MRYLFIIAAVFMCGCDSPPVAMEQCRASGGCCRNDVCVKYGDYLARPR